MGLVTDGEKNSPRVAHKTATLVALDQADNLFQIRFYSTLRFMFPIFLLLYCKIVLKNDKQFDRLLGGSLVTILCGSHMYIFHKNSQTLKIYK